MKETVVLIGFMGCGKSTVGEELAKKLGYSFIDTDQWIEEKTQKTISELFAEYGEEYFRELETKTISEMLDSEENAVISTGGGLPLRKINADMIKKNGFVVYLRVKGKTVEKRLKGDTTRPLLQGENVSEKINSLLEYRDPIYEYGAHLVVDVDEKKVEKIVEEITRNFQLMFAKYREKNNRD